MLAEISPQPPPLTEEAANEDFEERRKLLEQAIDTYGLYLQNYLYGLTGQWQDAENLLNDLFVFALHRFSKEKLTHVGMLRRKAYQLFVDLYRKRGRNPLEAREHLPEQSTPGYHEGISDEEDAAFKKRFFEEHPAGLTDLQMDVLWLHARHGYTFKEIGQKLHKPPSTIGDWIKQARAKLAEHY
ncbi:MAG: RNA polymerase sigma factor [Verrucomicrobiota bacterium]